ncbi:hypothetical protein ABK040_003536 [Willaertia magna]
MKKVASLQNFLKRNNFTISATTLFCGNSNLFKSSLNTKCSLAYSSSSIVLNSNNKKYFYNNLYTRYTNFFNFFKTKQQEPIEETVMRYKEEEEKEIIEILKCLEDLYKSVEQQSRKEHDNFVKTGEPMSLELLEKMVAIVVYFFNTITPKLGLTSELFYTSSNGLKIWSIVTKVRLLLAKSLIQEWFTMNNFLEMYNIIDYIPAELEDDRICFNRMYKRYLSNSAFIPTILNFIPHTRESFISSIYLIICNLKDAPPINDQFLSFMKEIVREYPMIKERYLNAKIVEDKYQMIYEQDKEFTFLEKKYSEHEFDWFEDLETNLPLNLNSLIKLIEAYLYFPQDINRFNELLDESLRIDPNNFYTLFIKANYSRFTPTKYKHELDLAIEAKELCERGLEILQKAKPLPLRQEIKLEEGETLP